MIKLNACLNAQEIELLSVYHASLIMDVGKSVLVQAQAIVYENAYYRRLLDIDSRCSHIYRVRASTVIS